MKKEKQKLGPRQQAWVDSLLAHPERQLKGKLGNYYAITSEYKACCLGEACMIKAKLTKKKKPINSDNDIFSNHSNVKLSTIDVKYFGFRTGSGEFNKPIEVYKTFYYNLVQLNDNTTLGWKGIAEIIINDPANVFIEPK